MVRSMSGRSSVGVFSQPQDNGRGARKRFAQLRKVGVARRLGHKEPAVLDDPNVHPAFAGLGRHYPCRTTTGRGRIHSVIVSTPCLVIPVIATKRVGCGTTEDFGASVTGSKESSLSQNLLSGSNRLPAS